jgi:membrane protein DedA with SNARE-associated domain
MDIFPSFDIGWLDYLTTILIEIGEKYKYLNFFIGMFLESVGIPFASMPAFASTGYLLAQGKFDFWWAVVIGGLGNAIGSSVSYGLGFYFGRAIRKKRPGQQLGAREERLKSYITRYGTKTIFFAQLLGFTRVFISFPAGLMKMDFKKFFLATLTGGMIFVIYFAFGTTLVINLYDKFVYPYIGLSFLSLGFILGFGYALTHVSLHFGKQAHAKIKERINGDDQNNKN